MAAAFVSVAVIAGACSGDSEPAVVTTTTTPPRPTSSLPPTSTPEAQAQSQPLQPDWSVQVGGSGDDRLLAVSGSGERVLAAGATAGLDVPAAGVSDVLVTVVASADGTVESTEASGSAGADSAQSVAGSTTGAAVACGSTDGALGAPPVGLAEAWCAPVAEDGTLGAVTQTGSAGDDRINGVALEPDGTFGYTAGSSDGLYPGAQDPTGGFLGMTDALVLRIEPDGRPRWARQFGSETADSASGVVVAEDGDALVAGSTERFTENPDLGSGDAWLARMDPSGNQRWETAFGTSGADNALAVAVGGQASRGSEIVVGAGSTTGTLGGPSQGGEQFDGAEEPDGGNGTADLSGPAGGVDALVAAAGSAGDLLWTTQFGSPGDDLASGVVVDGPVVYVAGTSSQPIEGAERVELPGAPSSEGGARDGYLAALDAVSGEVLWVALFGTPAEEEVTGLARTEDGHLVVSGATTGQIGTTAPAGGSDGFLIAFPLPSTGGGASSIV